MEACRLWAFSLSVTSGDAIDAGREPTAVSKAMRQAASRGGQKRHRKTAPSTFGIDTEFAKPFWPATLLRRHRFPLV
jgi:hypothetical protein